MWLVVFAVCVGVAFEAGREFEQQMAAGSGGAAGDAGELADTTLRELWRAPVAAPRRRAPPRVSTRTGEAVTPSETEVPAQCGTRCGVLRWQVKTLSDVDRGAVSFTPVDATIAELGALPRPARIPPAQRARPYETTVYRVRGYLASVSDQADRDVHLVLFDPAEQRVSIIAEIPDFTCDGACRSGFAGRYAEARRALQEGLNRWSAAGRDDPILVEVVGVGFFDRNHGQVGAAQNLFELHPVLSIRFLP